LSRGVNEIERFAYGGATLVAERLGEAANRHIVLMHGWGQNRESFRAIGLLFQTTHRVHLLDLPGFGDAPVPPDDWDTLRYTDLVQQYLLERISGSAILVGHSFGGRVSVRLAARRLAPIHGLVLMGVPGLPVDRFSTTYLRRLAIRELRSFLRAMQGVTGPGPLEWHTRRFGSRDYLAAGPMRAVLVRTVSEDLTESTKAIACPVLLLWGSDDTETPPWIAHRYQQLLNGRATLAMLPHKDHFLNQGTGAHLCAFKMRRWLGAIGE
jgi:pimeloyl-ACP methyl ester carboxylesterase